MGFFVNLLVKNDRDNPTKFLIFACSQSSLSVILLIKWTLILGNVFSLLWFRHHPEIAVQKRTALLIWMLWLRKDINNNWEVFFLYWLRDLCLLVLSERGKKTPCIWLVGILPEQKLQVAVQMQLFLSVHIGFIFWSFYILLAPMGVALNWSWKLLF